MNNNDLENTIDEFMETQSDFVSPYRLAKICSVLVGYEVIPQMIYSYVSQKFIEVTLNDLGKKQISRVEATRWLKKYVVKNYMKKS